MLRSQAVESRVRPLREGEVPVASRLLAAAFADDPFIGWFFRDRWRRRLALPRFFGAVLYELLPGGAVFAIEPDGVLAGVAAWTPPSVEPLSPVRARLSALQVRAIFPRAARRLRGGFATLAEYHPSFPHWYLAFVGIDPGAQRRGLGRALLEPVLVEADAAGGACYLETPFPGTRSFYERLGYEETAELEPVRGAPRIWTMTRPAAAAR